MSQIKSLVLCLLGMLVVSSVSAKTAIERFESTFPELVSQPCEDKRFADVNYDSAKSIKVRLLFKNEMDKIWEQADGDASTHIALLDNFDFKRQMHPGEKRKLDFWYLTAFAKQYNEKYALKKLRKILSSQNASKETKKNALEWIFFYAIDLETACEVDFYADVYQKFVETVETDWLVELALVKYRAGKLEDAIALLNRFKSSTDTNNSGEYRTAHFYLMAAYYYSGQYEKAAEAGELAEQIYIGRRFGYLAAAINHLKLNHSNKAIAIYEEHLRKQPPSTEWFKLLAARDWMTLDQKNRACKYWSQIHFPDRMRTWETGHVSASEIRQLKQLCAK